MRSGDAQALAISTPLIVNIPQADQTLPKCGSKQGHIVTDDVRQIFAQKRAGRVKHPEGRLKTAQEGSNTPKGGSKARRKG